MSMSKKFVFTLNNYTEGDVQLLEDLLKSDHVTYGIYGRETGGETGTPHLQGYVIFNVRKRFDSVKRLLGSRYHIEVSRGSPSQASEYCEKEGNFKKFGELPSDSQSGKRTDIERFKDWLKSLDACPTRIEIMENFPTLYMRYKANCLEMAEALTPKPTLVDGELKPWQQTLHDRLELPPDDRSIMFFVDHDGKNGKSWFTRYYMSKYPDKTQVIRLGKRDDMAHAVDVTKSVFLFDVPRGSMEYFQYSILEMLKDRIVFSPKYDSSTKILREQPHVVVLCNEVPDRTKLTKDRYKVTHLRRL